MRFYYFALFLSFHYIICLFTHIMQSLKEHIVFTYFYVSPPQLWHAHRHMNSALIVESRKRLLGNRKSRFAVLWRRETTHTHVYTYIFTIFRYAQVWKRGNVMQLLLCINKAWLQRVGVSMIHSLTRARSSLKTLWLSCIPSLYLKCHKTTDTVLMYNHQATYMTIGLL